MKLSGYTLHLTSYEFWMVNIVESQTTNLQPSKAQLQSPTEHPISIRKKDVKQIFDLSCSASFPANFQSPIDFRPNLIKLIYATPRFYWMNVKPLRGFSADKLLLFFIQLVITLIFFRRRLWGIVSAVK